MMRNRGTWETVKRECRFDYDRDHPYSHAVRGFKIFCKKQGTSPKLNPRRITAYISQFKPGTGNLYRTGLKLWYLSRARSELGRFRVLENFEKIRRTYPASGADRRDYVRLDELQEIAASMSRRYQCIALAYFYTGARNSELRLVKLTDCEMRGSEVIIRIHGKGRRERFVSMPAEIYHDARTIFRGNVYLFETAQGRPYSRSMINNELTRQSSRTHRIHIHTLRHSAAMYQVGRGISIERVSKYLGHSSASTTATYYLHGDAPSAREQGFGEVGSILVSIEAARKQRKQSRSPWRRHNGRGSFQRGLARG